MEFKKIWQGMQIVREGMVQVGLSYEEGKVKLRIRSEEWEVRSEKWGIKE